MEVEEFLKEAAVMKEVKHPNLVQLLGEWRFFDAFDNSLAWLCSNGFSCVCHLLSQVCALWSLRSTS